MKPSYKDPLAGQEYADFSASADGQQQHKLILSALNPLLPPSVDTTILDVGCGDGWLSGELSKKYKFVSGCDISEELISIAKKNYPSIPFEVLDVSVKTNFKKDSFDVVLASLVLHNIQDQQRALTNLYDALKPGGKFILISINPYYAYPIGVWKRGLVGRFFNKKPKLKLRPYFEYLSTLRTHLWSNKRIPLRFSPLPEQINNALSVGFNLVSVADLKSFSQNGLYDFNYRSSLFPLLILLEFQKPDNI